MVRNVVGSLIALIGAAAAVWSPFRPWYDGRHGRDVRIEDLFGNMTDNKAMLFGSLLLPMAVAALVTLTGVALRSRLLVSLAGIVVLGFTILWMVRQGQRAGELSAGAHGLGVGAAGALGAGALILLGALVMSGRPARVRRDERVYDDGYGHYDGYDQGEPARPAPPEPFDPSNPVPREWQSEPYPQEPYPQQPRPQDRQHQPTQSMRRQPPVEWGKERPADPQRPRDDRE
ncbi:hypothetical protein [Streptomyces piniterrae]|uniref:hypothetical protein n=1 Tax=Streptomyces piniterrae TaxID=2571125 RepID=UPI001FE47FC5|nr:hypothetical protein [Streptomyces piniterrae]